MASYGKLMNKRSNKQEIVVLPAPEITGEIKQEDFEKVLKDQEVWAAAQTPAKLTDEIYNPQLSTQILIESYEVKKVITTTITTITTIKQKTKTTTITTRTRTTIT